jgi:hypothetical protein
MVNTLGRNRVFLNGIGQKRKGQMQMWTEYEQTVNQQCYLEVLTR